MANATATTATVEQHAGGHEAAEPTIHGIGAGAIVAAAMFVFLLILAWKKVPLTLPRRPPKLPSGLPWPSERSASGASSPVAVTCA